MPESLSFIEIIDQVITSSKARLPVFNTTAARVQQEVAKDEPDTRRIEQLIVSDQALTAEVLRMSNSSFFKGLTQVATVRNAIVRMGVNEVANIVMTVTHEGQFRSKDPFLHGVMRKLWRHALAVSVGAHWLARHCGLHPIAHEAFFAGLLHDLGKLFILTVIDDLVHSGTQRLSPSTSLLMEAMDHLHTTHGYTLMQHWNLPEHYARIARDHHLEPPDPEDHLALFVRLADKACNKLGHGLKTDPALVLLATPEAAELHLSEVDLAKMEIMLEDSPVLGSKA
jgi:HD-like signal output (HDOD) protein